MDFNKATQFVEALIFSSEEPLTEKSIGLVLSKHGVFDLRKIITSLVDNYKNKGINLVCIEKRWFFRTSLTLGDYLRIETEKKKKIIESNYRNTCYNILSSTCN